MYGYTYSKSMDQPSKVASPASGKLSRENEQFPVCVCAWSLWTTVQLCTGENVQSTNYLSQKGQDLHTLSFCKALVL